MNWVEIACLVGGAYFLVVEIVAVVGRRLGKPTSSWWTISQVFRRDGRNLLTIPFGWGVLSGHYFGPSLPYYRWQSYLLILLGLACIGRDVANRILPDDPAPKWALGVVFIAGTVSGAVLWSQG